MGESVRAPISFGFRGRRPSGDASRLPPGQYLERDFPVLSAGPTPHTPLTSWSFAIRGAVEKPASWSWDEFSALPHDTITVDIHCVTKWSKLGTVWTGVYDPQERDITYAWPTHRLPLRFDAFEEGLHPVTYPPSPPSV